MFISEIEIEKQHTKNELDSIHMQRLGKVVVLVGANGSGKSRLLRMIKTLQDNASYRGFVKVNGGDIKNIKLFEYVPKSPKIVDTSSQSPQENNNRLKEAKNEKNITEFQTRVYASINEICEKYITANSTVPELVISDEQKELANKTFIELKNQINSILIGANFSMGIDKKPRLFNKPLENANLSDGQGILLQYIIALINQGANLKEDILILDEPENHLHPEGLIKLIETLENYNENGQIWIATHNVPLISYLAFKDPYSIWYFLNGKVNRGYNNTQQVLFSLFGGKDNIEKLSDYLNEPGIFEANRYAWESLFEPKVVETGSDDKQIWQIKEIFKQYITDEGLKILDYGAGKGRLITNLFDGDIDSLTQNLINYYAYDLYPTHKETCIKSIALAYKNDTTERYFNDVKSISEKVGKLTFVLMTNVLHEVPPENWLEIFSSGGELDIILEDNGKLIIVEDQILLAGENAHKYGFIMLDRDELKVLFNCDDDKIMTSVHPSNSRLKCHIIDKSVLSSITKESIEIAIKLLKENSVTEIMKLKKEKPSSTIGRILGFWLQQLGNCELFLRGKK